MITNENQIPEEVKEQIPMYLDRSEQILGALHALFKEKIREFDSYLNDNKMTKSGGLLLSMVMTVIEQFHDYYFCSLLNQGERTQEEVLNIAQEYYLRLCERIKQTFEGVNLQ